MRQFVGPSQLNVGKGLNCISCQGNGHQVFNKTVQSSLFQHTKYTEFMNQNNGGIPYTTYGAKIPPPPYF